MRPLRLSLDAPVNNPYRPGVNLEIFSLPRSIQSHPQHAMILYDSSLAVISFNCKQSCTYVHTPRLSRFLPLNDSPLSNEAIACECVQRHPTIHSFSWSQRLERSLTHARHVTLLFPQCRLIYLAARLLCINRLHRIAYNSLGGCSLFVVVIVYFQTGRSACESSTRLPSRDVDH